MKKIEHQPFPQESRLNLKKRKSKDDLVMTKKTEKKNTNLHLQRDLAEPKKRRNPG